MPDSPSFAKTTLAAACLSAALVTGFATAGHAAAGVPTGFQTSDGTQIEDGYVLEPNNFFTNTTPAGTVDGTNTFSEYSPYAVVGSQQADPLAQNSMVVFTQSPNSLTGMDFDSTFLSGTGYKESEVEAYIASDFTDPDVTDSLAYDDFVSALYNNYGTANNPSDQVNAYVFTNGQPVGTVDPAQLSETTYPSDISGDTAQASSPYVGFGLTPSVAAVPEPSVLTLLFFSGSMIAGLTIRRRKRLNA